MNNHLPHPHPFFSFTHYLRSVLLHLWWLFRQQGKVYKKKKHWRFWELKKKCLLHWSSFGHTVWICLRSFVRQRCYLICLFPTFIKTSLSPPLLSLEIFCSDYRGFYLSIVSPSFFFHLTCFLLLRCRAQCVIVQRRLCWQGVTFQVRTSSGLAGHLSTRRRDHGQIFLRGVNTWIGGNTSALIKSPQLRISQMSSSSLLPPTALLLCFAGAFNTKI